MASINDDNVSLKEKGLVVEIILKEHVLIGSIFFKVKVLDFPILDLNLNNIGTISKKNVVKDVSTIICSVFFLLNTVFL